MAKDQEQPQRKLVYQSCRSLFTRVNALVRKTKSIRKLLLQNKHNFGALISKCNLGTTCNVAKELLDAGIFESTSKAQTQFPELFRSSDDCWNESESSDFEATRSEADAMEAIMSLEEEKNKVLHVPDLKRLPRGKGDLRRCIIILG